MKIIQYCQHVLGIGHLFRSLEICQALSDHEVVLVTGGPRVDAKLPDHVREERLPDLQMNQEFKGLFSSRENSTPEQIKADRQKSLLALFASEKPDIFLVELYPFGRKAFRFELDPVLEEINHKKPPACGVVCSVRDILVEKEDQVKHETRVVKTLNKYFDAVLVHADPNLAQLNETFDQYEEIKIPVVYTGYIAPKPKTDAAQKIRRHLRVGDDELLIIASAGGGNVGAPLLAAAVQAFNQLTVEKTCYLNVFSGPFLERADFDDLKNMAGPNVQIEQFTSDFPAYLAAADLSISMGGYNTTMNILSTGVPALVWPFAQNREQRLRAGRLAKEGLLKVLENEDLQPQRLAGLMDQMLAAPNRRSGDFDLNGAINTAKWIGSWTLD
ncbi:MAG: glycosyl transferase [bacterium]|nr:glycosyl transferase [bacterium]